MSTCIAYGLYDVVSEEPVYSTVFYLPVIDEPDDSVVKRCDKIALRRIRDLAVSLKERKADVGFMNYPSDYVFARLFSVGIPDATALFAGSVRAAGSVVSSSVVSAFSDIVPAGAPEDDSVVNGKVEVTD